MQEFLSTVRVALRSLRRAPGFAGVVIATLAIAIGANTAIFSVVDGVLLRPLPYPEADRLVTVATQGRQATGRDLDVAFSDGGYWHFAEKNRVFERFGGYMDAVRWTLTGTGAPVQVNVHPMTVSAFHTVGTLPQLGRLPRDEEARWGGPEVALISDGLWRSAYGADPGIVGKTITVDQRPRQVIGVMPREYAFPNPQADAWIPLPLDRAAANFSNHYLRGIARLKRGETAESATADAASLVARFGEAGYTEMWLTDLFSGKVKVQSFKDGLVADARRPLLILLGTALFVLLIACSNVANLVAVRMDGRAREFAVRAALGSGRMRLMRTVMTESILLALLGSVVGVFLAWAGTRLLMAAAPPTLPRLEEVGISWRALAFTGGVSILTGVLVGLAPTLRMGSPRLLATLQDSSRGGTAGRGRLRSRNLLVVSQTGVCLLLLVGAGLMVRSFRELRSVDPGFRSSGVLTFRVAPSWAKYQQPEDVAAFYDQFLGEIRSLPGVVAAGATTLLPLGGEGGRLATQIEDAPTEAGKLPPVFLIRRVTPGYFSAIGVRLHEGREMNNEDHGLRRGSAIVSESLKKRYWPRESALGKRLIATGAPSGIVGVVGDLPHEGIDKPSVETVYIPMLDAIPGPAENSYSVAVRANEPLRLVPQIRQVAQRLDRDLPITDVQLMDEVVASSMSRTTFTMWLLVVAAVAGLFLAAVGVYGVTAYVVSQRTREIGIRLALGAEPRAIRALVLRQGMLLGAAGIGLGLVGAVILGRVVASLLFGVTPYDPATLLLAPAVVMIATALALVIPSRSAAATEPAVALSAE